MLKQKVIYHYCSTEKAFSILKGRSIRLSDITKSNDKLEMNILFPAFFDEMIHIFDASGGFSNQFIYKNNADTKAWYVFVKELEEKINPLLKNGEIATYVMCFSEKGDLLSQWRGYADDAQGFVLGFNIELLQKYTNDYGEILNLEKVKYISKEERKGLIYDSANEILQIMEMILNAQKNGDITFVSQEEFEERIFINIYYNILQIINEKICYKMDGFKEECEWRLYINNPINKNSKNYELVRYLGNNHAYNQKLTQYIEDRLNFHITNRDIVPFIEISLDDIEDKFVEEIIKGPNNLSKESDLKIFLRKYNYDHCSVRHSKLSYVAR